jgi:glutamate dehydrogenase (NAD(P)+)
MAWMMDEYAVMRGYNVPGVITGKPLPLGGSAGRGDATARGGMYTIREAAKLLGIDLSKATVAIQGYGNAGQFAHQLVTDMFGCKVVAVSDSKGGVHAEHGLDYEKVMEWKAQEGTVASYQCCEEAKKITNEDLLELDVDILVPAALENQIGNWNAKDIKAKIVAELANGPTTPEADEILHREGVYVIPDFLCNAGGVTVSYFEQVQNAYDFYWETDEVYERLDKKMTAAFHAVHEAAQGYKVHNRMGAYIVSVARVAEAMKLRGWV